MYLLPVLFFLFILGIAVGSFINVLIDRIPQDKTIRGRSYCDNCQATLNWYDLIPLVSFLLLTGRCRYCRKRISFQYPLVEFITGLNFMGVYLFNQNYTSSPLFPPYLFFVTASLISIFFVDIKYGIIPDKIVFPTLLLVILYQIYLITQGALIPATFGKTLLGGLAVSGFFLFLIVLTKGRGMGGGDVKLGFLIALLSEWPKLVLTIYLAFILGGIAAIVLLLSKRKKFGETIPFGPFLVVSFYIILLFSERLSSLFFVWG